MPQRRIAAPMIQPRLGCLQNLPGEIALGLVMLAEDCQLKGHRAEAARRDITESDDVTQRLAHLAAVNFDVVIV